MSLLSSVNEFEWMSSRISSSPSAASKRGYLFPQGNHDDYEEEIKFTKQRKHGSSKAQKNPVKVSRNMPSLMDSASVSRDAMNESSPLMNFKLLDLTSFDDYDELRTSGSCGTDGATVDPDEVPLYNGANNTGPFGRGQDAWVRFNGSNSQRSLHGDEDQVDGKSIATTGTARTMYTTGTSSQASNANNSKWDSYKEDVREDPECEYFDLTALSSDDVNMDATASQQQQYQQQRRTVADHQVSTSSRYISYKDELDEQGNHPADYYDLTVLSQEQEEAFDKVLNVVSQVTRHGANRAPQAPYDVERTPFELDIVDLTANSDPDREILDLTALGGDGPEPEQLTDNGSVIVDLTRIHYMEENPNYADHWPASESKAAAPASSEVDPYPDLPDFPTRSNDSYGSRSSRTSSYRGSGSGSFDWMTQKRGDGQQQKSQGTRQSVRWLDQVSSQKQKEKSQPPAAQEEPPSSSHHLSKFKNSRKEPKGACKTDQAKDPDGMNKTDVGTPPRVSRIADMPEDPSETFETAKEEEQEILDDIDEEGTEADDDDLLDSIEAISDSDDVKKRREAREEAHQELSLPLSFTSSRDAAAVDEAIANLISKARERAKSPPIRNGQQTSSPSRSSPPRSPKTTAASQTTKAQQPKAQQSPSGNRSVGSGSVDGSTTNFLDMLLKPAKDVCQATAKQHLARGDSRLLTGSSDESQQKGSPKTKKQDGQQRRWKEILESPRFNKQSKSRPESPRKEKTTNEKGARSPRQKGSESQHYDLTQDHNAMLAQSKSYDSRELQIKEPPTLKKVDLDKWRAAIDTKDSEVKRERIDKLRSQRKKRQQALSTFLETGKRSTSREEEQEVAAPVEHGSSNNLMANAKGDIKKGDHHARSPSAMSFGASTITSAHGSHTDDIEKNPILNLKDKDKDRDHADQGLTKAKSKDKSKTKGDKEKDKSKSKSKKDKKKKDKKKKKSKKKKKKSKAKAKETSGIVMTWKRVKSKLTPKPWKKRDVALFQPSTSEDDTDHDNKLRREEVRRSIERAALESVRNSRSSEKPSYLRSASKDGLKIPRPFSKKNKKNSKPSRKTDYDGDADTTSSEHEARKKEYHKHQEDPDESTVDTDSRNKDPLGHKLLVETDAEENTFVDTSTIEGGDFEMDLLAQIDLEVQEQTAQAAQAAIAIAAASRSEEKSARVAFIEGTRSEDPPSMEAATSSDSDSDGLVEAGAGNYYYTEKDGKSVDSRSQVTQDVGTSYYDTAEEATTDYLKSDEDNYYSLDEPDMDGSFRSAESGPSLASSRASAYSNQKSIQGHSTSLVPRNPALIVDPESNSGKANVADYSWLYGKDVKLPYFVNACPLHCCDVFQTSQLSPEADEHKASKKETRGKSSGDSQTHTTAEVSNGTAMTPIACWYPSVECIDDATLQSQCKSVKIGDVATNPFGCPEGSQLLDQSQGCSVDFPDYKSLGMSVGHQSLGHQSLGHSVNPASDTDTEPSPTVSLPINSTVNLVFHACGIALHTQKSIDDAALTNKESSGIPDLPLSCADSPLFGDEKSQGKSHNGMVVPSECGAMENSARKLKGYAADALLGRCVGPATCGVGQSRSGRTRSKKTADSLSSRPRRRRSRRRSRRDEEDFIEDHISYSYETTQSETIVLHDTEKGVYDGIAQATEDAIAMLSKQALIKAASQDTQDMKTSDVLESQRRSTASLSVDDIIEIGAAEEKQLDQSMRSGQTDIKSARSGNVSAHADLKSTTSGRLSAYSSVRSVRKRPPARITRPAPAPEMALSSNGSKSPINALMGKSARLGADNAPVASSDNVSRSTYASKDHGEAQSVSNCSTENMSNLGGSSTRHDQDHESASAGEAAPSDRSGSPNTQNTQPSKNSLMDTSLFAEEERSYEDISLGYSDSNMDAWSFDAPVDAASPDKGEAPLLQAKLKKARTKVPGKKQPKVKENPQQDQANEPAKAVKATPPPPPSSQPISNFMMSIFGAPPARTKEDDEKEKVALQEAAEDNKPSLSLTDIMERPQSLKSLASYRSEEDGPGIASDRSMSSLSLSMNGTKKPSSSLDRRRLEQLVSDLMCHPNGYVFGSPVDLKEFPDYTRIIRHPMDLGTVLKRLLSSGYPNLLDFHADVSLVFDNAMQYNAEGSKIHYMAMDLKDMFENSFLDLLDDLEAELMEKEEEARLAI